MYIMLILLSHIVIHNLLTYYILAGRRCDGQLRLEHILKFITGSYTEPLLGFGLQPRIKFALDSAGFLCRGNTCSNVLYLPYSLTNYIGDDRLYDKFDVSFSNTYFGRD